MIRQLWTVGLTVLACCLVMLAASHLTPGAAQQPGRPPAPPIARYQLVPLGNVLVLLDTHTGQAWERIERDWNDIKTPPSQR